MDDAALAELADREGRILLTRDQGLLKRRMVTHGYFIRETHPHGQLVQTERESTVAVTVYSTRTSGPRRVSSRLSAGIPMM